jgi:hypothetical protein
MESLRTAAKQCDRDMLKDSSRRGVESLFIRAMTRRTDQIGSLHLSIGFDALWRKRLRVTARRTLTLRKQILRCSCAEAGNLRGRSVKGGRGLRSYPRPRHALVTVAPDAIKSSLQSSTYSKSSRASILVHHLQERLLLASLIPESRASAVEMFDRRGSAGWKKRRRHPRLQSRLRIPQRLTVPQRRRWLLSVCCWRVPFVGGSGGDWGSGTAPHKLRRGGPTSRRTSLTDENPSAKSPKAHERKLKTDES